ncbi:SAMC1 [Symbiodinium sp. KB8]|nr:SAMC1 [Symbiodinium sp. KB8]
MMVDFVLYPLDTIKTRLQTKGGAGKVNKNSLFSGLLSAMLGSFPGAATFWTAYSGSKSLLAPLAGGDSAAAAGLVHGLAAAMADVAVVAVRNPFEVVKQQMQAGMHSSSLTAAKTILRNQGVAGLYAGYFSTVLREVPFDAAQFMLYEWMKGKARKARGGRDLVLWENAILGSIAGGCSAAVTTPLDVVKTRLMTQGTSRAYTGVWHGLTTVAREEGVAALFSGIVPRVMWISLGGAIFIGSFEEFRRRLTAKPE